MARRRITLPPDDPEFPRGGKAEDAEKRFPPTLTALVATGDLLLGENQRIRGNRVVTLTARELLDEKAIDLGAYKLRRIEELSTEALQLRRELIPDYKLLNAGLGIYGEAEVAEIKATVQAFREAYHAAAAQVEKARSANAVDAVAPAFPKKTVKPGARPATASKGAAESPAKVTDEAPPKTRGRAATASSSRKGATTGRKRS